MVRERNQADFNSGWLECNNPHVKSRAMEALRTAEGNSLKKWQLTKKVRHNDPIRMVNLNRVLADLLAAGRIYCEKRRAGLGRSGELWGLLAQPEADGR